MAGSDALETPERLKIILVGPTGAGKTCIAVRFFEDSFSPNTVSTIGASHFTRVIHFGLSRVILHVWDTVGQERYRAVLPQYYRGAAGAVVVYDIANAETFEALDWWIGEVKRHVTPEPPMILIGNKSDLSTERQVAQQQGEEFAKHHDMKYLETSAKTGEGVADIFRLIGQLAFNHVTPQADNKETIALPGDDMSRRKRSCRC